ncbi:hypothetical protein [Agrobacterium sp. NPDC089420]|uniref:hypothetical protein n=1 Tax=Agrobacterium sp. NPDC089420 TaxID=3363918 RepID=UPI00384E6251
MKKRTPDITDGIISFSETILDAQQATLKRIDFFIQKAKFYNRFRGQLNELQEKVIARIFKEEMAGFEAGAKRRKIQLDRRPIPRYSDTRSSAVRGERCTYA